MELAAVLICIVVACSCAGLVAALLVRIRHAEGLLCAQVKEFAHITQEASSANQSLALKIAELEKRVEVTEFRSQGGVAFGQGAKK